jgi:carbamoyl-phosphate synthase small subunit
VNLNDNSIEGIKLKDQPAFSVQYHPESTPGPHDSRYLFDDFINMIKEYMN